MEKLVLLAARPDLVLKLEKYGVLPPCKSGGVYEGCAKKWAKEKVAPYDTPQYQAMAERLPAGWEELTEVEVNQLLAKLQEKIAVKRKEKLDARDFGSEEMFRKLIKISLLGIGVATALVEEGGLGNLPEIDEGDKKRAHQFSVEMILHLLNGSNLFYELFREGAKLIKTDVQQQETIADILKTAAMLVIIFTAAGGHEDRRNALLLSVQVAVQEGLDKAERLANEAWIDKAVAGRIAKGTVLYLQQARIAMAKQDFDGLQMALEELLGLHQLTHDKLVKDLKQMYKLAGQLRRAFTVGMDDETNKITAFSQLM